MFDRREVYKRFAAFYLKIADEVRSGVEKLRYLTLASEYHQRALAEDQPTAEPAAIPVNTEMPQKPNGELT